MRGAALITLLLLFAYSANGKPLHLYVDWFPSPEYAGFLAAEEHDWYRAAGIDLRIHYRQSKIAEKIAAGKADLALMPASQMIYRIGQGLKLKAIAAHLQFSPETIVVCQGSPVQNVGQLRGKRLGISNDDDIRTYGVVLAHVGVALNEVKFVRIPEYENNGLTWLREKKVDALLAWEFHWPLRAARMGIPLRQFPAYRHGYYYYGEVFVVRADRIKTDRQRLARFLEVTRRGWQEVFKDPARYAEKLAARARAAGVKPSVEEERIELSLIERFLFDGVPFDRYGQMTQLAWRRSTETSQTRGLLPSGKSFLPDVFYDASVFQLSLGEQP